ncbi:hypothetical protein Z950_27 [Sulfitobacter mediterraneus KCTC 32188]|nr:hypothetical protein Z950_27 [Sulfitobacter mediterraneus KCTC 32188]
MIQAESAAFIGLSNRNFSSARRLRSPAAQNSAGCGKFGQFWFLMRI